MTAEDKLSFSKVDRLFESYKRLIKDYYNDDKQALLVEIRDYAAIFNKCFNLEIVDNELSAEAGIERLNAVVFALLCCTREGNKRRLGGQTTKTPS